ncbi:MAG: methyltransferase domain-containing protein [Betaproteobacteria bacterium]|nr:methyltransferase domain-containing protein [Betaproteobacteria bacterium]
MSPGAGLEPAAPSRRGGWREARDRLVANPRFRRWASAFPLTRFIARRRAGRLFDLCAGFVYSQVLLACVRLRLFDLLADGPLGVGELASRLRLEPAAAERLLRAAASLDLLERRGADRFGLGPLGAAMVGDAGTTAMIEHHAILYGDLGDPVRLLRERGQGTRLAGYWPYAGTGEPGPLAEESVASYTRLMAASAPLVADEVLAAYPFQRHDCLLDVGGGDGTFIAMAARRHPRLAAILFDLPAVAAHAAARFEREGLGLRARAVGGSFRADPIPGGADVATLVRILHDHDDDVVLALLRNVHRALPPGGTLVVAEPMSGVPGVERMADAYFGFYLLAMGTGRARTPEELGALLVQAGFEAPRRLPTRIPVAAQVLVSTRSRNEL